MHLHGFSQTIPLSFPEHLIVTFTIPLSLLTLIFLFRVRYMPKTGWKHQSSSSDIVPVKAASTKYGKNKFCERLPETNRKNRLSPTRPTRATTTTKKKTNIHEVSLLLGYLK